MRVRIRGFRIGNTGSWRCSVNDRFVVDVALLHDVVGQVFKKLEELHGSSIEVEHDMFWTITKEDLYNVVSEPRDFTIGQLSESFTNLERSVARDDWLISFCLVWVADILRAIGHEYVV